MGGSRADFAFDSVFIYHVRKAGGTSLRAWCRALALEKGVPYDVCEGWSLDHERHFERLPTALHVICLREPIERLKSSYRFEGRWHQHETERTRENAQSFAAFVDETRCSSGRSGRLWKCSENYYVKALIGYPRGGQPDVGRADLELAKRRLGEFEIVLITEWLSADDTAAYLRRQLRFERPVPHRRYPEHESPPATDEELFDPSTLAAVREANRLDQELYDHARALFRRRLRVGRPGS